MAWNEADLPERYRKQVKAQLEPQHVKPIPVAIAATSKSKMNGLETRYSQLLQQGVIEDQIAAWRFEPVSLRLGDNTFYRPDFMVIRSTGQIEFHETKGYWREDARVKIKVAATAFPWFTFYAIQEKHSAFVYERFDAR